MNIFKTALLSHFQAVQTCLRRYGGAEATFSMDDFVLQVRARNRYYALYPQFLGSSQGQRMYYSRHLEPNSKGFAGWRPYVNKRWPIGSGKFAFKDYCERNGLRTPPMHRTPSPELRDFIVKHDNRSFGQGIHGPFTKYDAHDPKQVLDEQGYYEQFVRGRIVKATYWEDRLAAVELKRMATVEGDGKSTLKTLIAAMLHRETPEDEWQPLVAVAAYQGLELESVPAAGRKVLVDFRYSSYANIFDVKEVLDPQVDLAGTPLLEQLLACGPALWQGIPEESRPATLFTLDAILDQDERLWLLEMNCNPVCHPRAYPMMFETLFGRPENIELGAQVPASALPHQAPDIRLGGRMDMTLAGRIAAPAPGRMLRIA